MDSWNWFWSVDWTDALDAFESLMTGIALGVAGVWAFYKYVLEGYEEPSLHVKVTCNVLQESANSTSVVSVRAEVTNVGKIPCQVDSDRSTVEINIVKVNGTESWPSVALRDQGRLLEGIRNIPPGSTTAFTNFIQIQRPATCGVVVFIALTERGAKRFYRRIGKKLPDNWRDERVGFYDGTVIEVR